MSTIVLFILETIAVILYTTIATPQSLFGNIQLFLVVIIALVFFNRSQRVYWVALWTGLLLDLFSPLPFGTHMLFLLALVGLLRYLFRRFFTNRSLYSIILLTTIATALYRPLLYSTSWVLSALHLSAYILPLSWQQLLWQILGNVLAMLCIFYLHYFFAPPTQQQTSYRHDPMFAP